MEKKVSKIKVFFCALLGYTVLNMVRNILFAIAAIIINAIGFGFLERIAFFFTFIAGAFVANLIGEKILKTDDAVRRYNFTLGMLLIINYMIFLISYFMYNEGSLLQITSAIVIGFGYVMCNRKEKE